MDKRTLFFVLSLTVTLFIVNTLFDKPREENLREWAKEQKAKNEELVTTLTKQIDEKTVKSEQLPLVEIFADKDQKEKVTTAYKSDNSIIALYWNQEPPKEIYSGKEHYYLTYSGNFIVYQKNPEDPLLIGNLSPFGVNELQLVEPSTKKTLLAEMNDGQFSILQSRVNKLKELPQDEMGQALVLIKSDEQYLPVGFYNGNGSIIYFEQIADLNTQLVSLQKEVVKYYVIENEYQQLVFSNIGASLAEINLPFKNPKDKESVVKEIQFDRDIQENHPQDALFPLYPYITADKVTHSKGKLGGYYPLLRRDLIRGPGKKSIRILPEYFAFNIVSQYPEMAELVYEVTHFDNKSITFEAKQRNRKIIKTFTTTDAPYVVNLTVKVEGDARGLWLTSGVPEVEWISNAPAPALKYRLTRKGSPEITSLDLPEKPMVNNSVAPDWICNSNGFFGTILDPLSSIDSGFKAQSIPGVNVPSRLLLIDAEYDRFEAKNLPGYTLMLPLKAEGGTMEFRIFAGPFAESVLKSVDALYTNAETGYNPDYLASQSFHGWFAFISAPISKFLFIVMKFFYFLTGSWAFSIILLTVALRILLYPLNAWSSKSMLKMQKISPEVTKIQEKHKKDPKKAQVEIMNLYRESGVNPLSGCFPLLIQMPFLIGMFDLLKSAFELRGASFIPGWINDLAAPDVLFEWKTPIWFFGNQFHLLPLILGAVMLIQQRLMATGPSDPNEMTEQQRQQKFMGNIMAVVFAVMFYNFPAGLNIYWLSSMLLGILQQWWTAKTYKMPAKKKIN